MHPVIIAGPFGYRAHHFADDGIVPNHPKLPAIVYDGAVTFNEPDDEPAGEALDDLVQENGWFVSWTGSIYRRVHYHSNTHECLVVFNGVAKVELGGRRLGKVIEVKGGDAILIPAGVGHRRIESSKDFIVFGVYPIGKQYDLCWDWERLRARSKARIRRVPLPADDPFFGKGGPMLKEWEK